jgi:nucleoside-diphosphate-sugar epimerase
VRDCEDCPAAAYRVNVTGGFNILEAARILGISDVIFVGSAMIYGSIPPRKIDDDTVQRPTIMYAATKACCEHLGNYYHRKYDLNFRGIRFPMVIGPGREISYYYGDYSGAVEMPARGKPYTIHVDASNPSALIYVKDVARALIALKKADPGKLRQRMYNVHGFTATMSEVAEVVKRVLPEAQIEFNWDQSDEMRLANSAVYYELDNTAAREDFGWQPQYPLDKMSQDFIKEIKAQLDLQ